MDKTVRRQPLPAWQDITEPGQTTHKKWTLELAELPTSEGDTRFWVEAYEWVDGRPGSWNLRVQTRGWRFPLQTIANNTFCPGEEGEPRMNAEDSIRTLQQMFGAVVPTSLRAEAIKFGFQRGCDWFRITGQRDTDYDYAAGVQSAIDDFKP